MSGPSSRRTHGSAPMWSSWPCVSTIASILSAFSSRYSKSGSTRSMPSISIVGNIRPVSTTTMRSSYSTTVMFFPISPSPPSGRTRSLPVKPLLLRRGRHEPVGFQHGAHTRQLVLGQLDHRQPQAARLEAEQVERGFDGSGARREEQGLVHVLQLVVDLARALSVARHGGLVHLVHARADQMRRDADPARAAQL